MSVSPESVHSERRHQVEPAAGVDQHPHLASQTLTTWGGWAALLGDTVQKVVHTSLTSSPYRAHRWSRPPPLPLPCHVTLNELDSEGPRLCLGSFHTPAPGTAWLLAAASGGCGAAAAVKMSGHVRKQQHICGLWQPQWSSQHDGFYIKPFV